MVLINLHMINMQNKNRVCYGKAYTDADVWGGKQSRIKV